MSRSALVGNVRLLMSRTGGVALCAMIKANAYGHGTETVVRALSGAGISFWGVADLDEALALRAMNVTEPVLVMQPLEAYESKSALRERVELMSKHGIRATIAGESGLDLFVQRASGLNGKLFVHIMVDTGMGRSGCSRDETAGLVLKAVQAPNIILEGIYSHFAGADEPELQFAREQNKTFQAVTGSLEARGIRIPIKHIANSAAIFNIPDSYMDMVRPGLALYGYGGDNIKNFEPLVPALKLVAPVISTKWIKKGGACGYGSTFIAKRDTRAGLVPIGYADGYSRRLSNIGRMEAKGRLVPAIGRVSMDLTVIDLTDAPEADVGTEVCIVSNVREAPHSVESIAKQLNTIPNEVTARLGQRIQRVLVE